MTLAVIVFAVSIASLSAGNVLLKLGMDRFSSLTTDGVPAWLALLKTPFLTLGVLLMLVQFFGTLLLFKWGWEVSVVIPVMGLCYVGTAVLGRWVLGEPVGGLWWAGILLILIGVFFVARSVTPTRMP